MRIAAGLCLVLAALGQLALAGAHLVSSKVKEIDARAQAGDLSDVAGDLVDEKTLRAEQERTAAKVDRTGATRQLVLAVAAAVLALAQLIAAVLSFLRRSRGTTLALAAGSLIVLIGLSIWSGFSWLASGAGAALAVALVLTLLARPAAARAT